MEREKSLDQMSYEELDAIIEKHCKNYVSENLSNVCEGCLCEGLAACISIEAQLNDLIEAVKVIKGVKE